MFLVVVLFCSTTLSIIQQTDIWAQLLFRKSLILQHDLKIKKSCNTGEEIDPLRLKFPPLFRLSQVIEFDDGSGSVLRIQPLRTHRDEAIYECTAANSAGEINTSAKLTVLEGKISLFFSYTQPFPLTPLRCSF